MSPNLGNFGGVIEAEADLLRFLRLGRGTWRLQCWDLLVVGGHRLGVGDRTGHLDGEVGGFGKGETLYFSGIGDERLARTARTPACEGIFNTR